MHLLHSQRTDGGDKAGLVGLPLTERKAPTKTAREISAVRHAADDDCPAGCGHPEPAVLARRHWAGF